MWVKLKQRLPLLYVCITLLLGVNEASAFTSMGRQIESYCSSNGYPLLPAYENDTCDAACHRNSQGQSAYDRGDFEYFCPQPVVAGPVCTDADNDSFFAEGDICGTPADFNDNNAKAFPGATENCSDGVDNDGNGLVDAEDLNAVGCPVNCTDMDRDGYNLDGGSCGPVDCNDNDAAINPGAEENCSDGMDNNCNGRTDTADMNAVGCPLTCTDRDGDGYSIEGNACGAIDCDDNNDAVNPAALEICDDGIDNNCNNRSDASDNVCQTNSTVDDNQNVRPWWRSRVRSYTRDRDDERSNRRRSTDRGNDDDDNDEHDDESSSDDRDEQRSNRRSRRDRSSSMRRSFRDDD